MDVGALIDARKRLRERERERERKRETIAERGTL